MSGDSRSHHTADINRRFGRWLGIIGVVATVILVLALLLKDQRLEFAHRFGLVPDVGVEKIAGTDADLIVVPIQVQLRSPRPQIRYHAAAVSYPSSGGRTLTSVDSGTSVELPIPDYAFISTNTGGTVVFFREGPQAIPGRAFTLELASFKLTELPAGTAYPDEDPAWQVSLLDTLAGECDGISPNARYITCYGDPAGPVYLFGDYQLDVIIYGEPKRSAELYRGQGFRPMVGWSANDRWLYFENEHGIWRVEVTEELFPSKTGYGNL